MSPTRCPPPCSNLCVFKPARYSGGSSRREVAARGDFLIVGTIVFFLWFAGTMTNVILWSAIQSKNMSESIFRSGMLAFCITTLVTTAGERAVAFTPAEVDFFFPAHSPSAVARLQNRPQRVCCFVYCNHFLVRLPETCPALARRVDRDFSGADFRPVALDGDRPSRANHRRNALTPKLESSA